MIRNDNRPTRNANRERRKLRLSRKKESKVEKVNQTENADLFKTLMEIISLLKVFSLITVVK